jgi:hypothetical protein
MQLSTQSPWQAAAAQQPFGRSTASHGLESHHSFSAFQELIDEGRARAGSTAEPSGREEDGGPPHVNGRADRRRSRSPPGREQDARRDDDRDRWRDRDGDRKR